MPDNDLVVVIHPNGEYEQYNMSKLSLSDAQHFVGGCVEVVPLFDKFNGQKCVVLCDEEGKLKNKPINTRATIEWAKCVSLGGDMLVGPVVVVMGKAMKGWK